MKSCFIYQPHGIGDILFVQKIVHYYKTLGYKIIFPIIEYYQWAIPYLAQENVEFPIFTNDRQIIEPFEHSDQIDYLMKATGALFRRPVHALDFVYLPCGASTLDYKNDLMKSKYTVCDMDHSNWQNYIKINRNYEKENELYYRLGLRENDEYILVNEHSSGQHVEINPPGRIIKMSTISGYSFFDWIKVIENASRVLTIDTSLVYLVEIFAKPDIKCDMISRYNPIEFLDVPDILSRPWKYYSNANDIDFNE